MLSNIQVAQLHRLRIISSSLCSRPFITCVHPLNKQFHASTPHNNKSGFFGKFVQNIKQEMTKNKEMKENLKKFRQEAEKLEHSDALKRARQKYEAVESEASKSTEAIKERLGSIKGKMQEVMDEAAKSDIAKKAGHIKEGISRTARGAAETISESSSKLGKTEAFKTLSQTAQAVKEEIDESTLSSNVYKPPVKLHKREKITEDKNFAPNEDATGVELHKDSRFYQSWQNFKENNTYVNKLVDLKIRYDESDNPVIRASKLLTDKVTDVVGGLFQNTELSETLTEICKIDPSFDKAAFLKQCETEIIPNILEATLRGDLEVLKDWCHEGPYNILSKPVLQAQQMKLHFHSKILDIDRADLVMGKMMEQGPVLVISFQAQQILCFKDKLGNVVEGSEDKVLRVNYVWVLCRDVTELNPRAAWKLLDLSANSTEQLL